MRPGQIFVGICECNQSCDKLRGFWRFDDCGYQKGHGHCSRPEHLANCPLPRHDLRNGRLNQTAYSLFLFMRDVAGGDFVGWIDDQLAPTGQGIDPDALAIKREALIGPLRGVFGVSDKVISMAMSSLLLSAGRQRPLWSDVGASFVVVDTLVHNFLAPHRYSSQVWCQSSVWRGVLSAERLRDAD